MFEEFKEKLLGVMEECRNENGTFYASPYIKYQAVWYRDNTLVNFAYLHSDPEKYVQTVHTFTDFLHKQEYCQGKLSKMIEDPNFEGHKMKNFIHPKVSIYGDELPEMWEFRQADTPSWILLQHIVAKRHGIDTIRNQDDFNILQKVVRVIEAIKIYEKPYSGAWEEVSYVSLTNMMLAQEALEGAYELGFEVDREHLRKLRRKIAGMFPLESHNRHVDMAMLFPCVVSNRLSRIDTEEILFEVANNLNRQYGVIRYANDKYRPFTEDYDCNSDRQPCKNEMQWLLGLGYEAYIFAKLGHKESAIRIVEDVINRYPDARIPEGVSSDDSSILSLNSFLTWSCATFVNAIDAINDKFI